MQWVLHTNHFKTNAGYDSRSKVEPVDIKRRDLMKASKLLLDYVVKKNRQHQLRNETLHWRGESDPMSAPAV